jgi:hypothetical protein
MSSHQPLVLMTFSPKSPIQHWGLWLSSTVHGKGTFYELVLHNNAITSRRSKFSFESLFPKHGAKRRYECKITEDFDLNRFIQGGGHCHDLNTLSTRSRVEEATTRVMKEFKYSFLHENCQTFAIETLKLLSAWDPNLVRPEAVTLARQYSAIATRHARPRRTVNGERPRFTSTENANASNAWASESSDVFNPAIVVLPRDDGRSGGRRTRTTTNETSYDHVAAKPIQHTWADRTMRKGASEPVKRQGKERVKVRIVKSEGHGKMPGAWV